MSVPLIRVAVAVLALSPWALPVQAQTWADDDPASVRRPFAGLFGGRPSDADSAQSLDLSFSLYGAHDQNTVPETEEQPVDSRLQISGAYAGAKAQLDYMRRGDSYSFAMNGSTAVSQYPGIGDRLVASAAAADLSWELTRRINLQTALDVSSQPYYGPGLFSAAPLAIGRALPFVAPGTELSVLDTYFRRLDALAELSWRVSRRGSLSLLYRRRESESSDNVVFGLREERIGGRLRYGLLRHGSLNLGYAYRTTRYPQLGDGGALASHDVNAGLDYRRTLSISRRTTLSFGTGSTMLTSQPIDRPDLGLDGRDHFYLLADARLQREMGRTWATGISYRRSVQFLEGFVAPFQGDGVTVSLGGFAGRRLNVDAQASYFVGDVGFGVDSGYETFGGSAGLTLGMTRHVALYARFLSYNYEFQQGVQLPAGLPASLDRQSVRVGLRTWVPLLR